MRPRGSVLTAGEEMGEHPRVRFCPASEEPIFICFANQDSASEFICGTVFEDD